MTRCPASPAPPLLPGSNPDPSPNGRVCLSGPLRRRGGDGLGGGRGGVAVGAPLGISHLCGGGGERAGGGLPRRRLQRQVPTPPPLRGGLRHSPRALPLLKGLPLLKRLPPLERRPRGDLVVVEWKGGEGEEPLCDSSSSSCAETRTKQGRELSIGSLTRKVGLCALLLLCCVLLWGGRQVPQACLRARRSAVQSQRVQLVDKQPRRSEDTCATATRAPPFGALCVCYPTSKRRARPDQGRSAVVQGACATPRARASVLRAWFVSGPQGMYYQPTYFHVPWLLLLFLCFEKSTRFIFRDAGCPFGCGKSREFALGAPIFFRGLFM